MNIRPRHLTQSSSHSICLHDCYIIYSRFNLIFKLMHTKNLHFLQDVISKTIGVGYFKGKFFKIIRNNKLYTVVYKKAQTSKSRGNNLILISIEQCARYNNTILFYLKCYQFGVLWKCFSLIKCIFIHSMYSTRMPQPI